VGEEVEKECVVPACAFDFLAHGDAVGMAADDIERKSSQDRQVLWGVVFSGSRTVFVEDDIENPMQLVLDSPMTAHGVQQSLGGEELGKQVIARDRLSARLVRARLREVMRARATTPGKWFAAATLVSRMTVARRDSHRSWVESSMRLATLRMPARAKRRATASNSLP